MIHMITCDNRGLYAQQLTEMHQIRRRLFVEERGWGDLAVREDGGEYDAYDDERTIYFLGIEPDGSVAVGMRARPTDDKSMLADLFPALIGPNQPPINAPDVWEISRVFAVGAYRGRSGHRSRFDLPHSIVEAAAAQGVQRLVGMIDVFLLPHTLNIGWRVKPMGLPAAYAEGEAIAFTVETTPEGVAAMRDALGGPRSPLFRLDPASPLAVLAPNDAERFMEAATRLRPESLALAAKITQRVVELQDSKSEDELMLILEQVQATLGDGRLSGAG